MSGNNSGWKKSLEAIWYKLLLKAGSVIFKTLQEQRMQSFEAETAILTEKIFSTVENILNLVIRPCSGKIKQVFENSFVLFPLPSPYYSFFSAFHFHQGQPEGSVLGKQISVSTKPHMAQCTG